jgi:hypothetical protein
VEFNALYRLAACNTKFLESIKCIRSFFLRGFFFGEEAGWGMPGLVDVCKMNDVVHKSKRNSFELAHFRTPVLMFTHCFEGDVSENKCMGDSPSKLLKW